MLAYLELLVELLIAERQKSRSLHRRFTGQFLVLQDLRRRIRDLERRVRPN